MLTREQVTYLTNLLHRALLEDERVDYTCSKEELHRAVRQVVEAEVRADEDMKARARQRLMSLKRNVAEGSSEWDQLMKQYLHEERDKRRNVR